MFTNKLKMAWARRSSLRSIIANSRATYSQYGEDLVLDRLLKPRANGCYVDVGCNHPVGGSNTFKLYTKGWRGLAIDPNPTFQHDFKRLRPGDTYLAEGSARETSSLTYFEYENHLLNTFDQATVDKMRGYGMAPVRTRHVACRPLREAISEHLGDRQIDLLNVDCEGLDLEVLESLDLENIRPTVIIVEDFPRFLTFRDSVLPERMERFLRSFNYAPLAQVGWSGLYIAQDWETLFSRSDAYSVDAVQSGCLPGQATLESVGINEYTKI